LPLDTYASFVLSEGPRLYLKSAALVRIARRLGFPWNLAAALWIVPFPIRDWFYDLIARNRYRLFGKREQCVVLQSDDVRFLSGRSRPAKAEPRCTSSHADAHRSTARASSGG
jgi:predicted DCC family thiol-disulfide oxidoreductase YuxK